MLNRLDKIEIDEANKEVYVRDDFNIYILYECTLTDMQGLEEELLRIGSYFMARLEELYDSEVDKVMHKKDRQQVLYDLLQHELDFQFRKVKLTQLYMQCYEHICDPLEQQQLIQIIVDTMARRPRLALDALYFRDSYRAETTCLDKQIELLETVISNQFEFEKAENTHVHESLNMSYALAQRKNKDGWQYADADAYLQGLIDKVNQKQQAEEDRELSHMVDTNDGDPGSKLSGQEGKQARPSTKKKPTFQDPDFEMRNMRYTDQELDPEAFTKLLGLPKITLEQLFELSHENDDLVLDIMAE